MCLKRVFLNGWLCLFVTALCAAGQANTTGMGPDWSSMNSEGRFKALTLTSPAYQKEALHLLIEEANRVARKLNLAEQLPITQTNLLEAYISPPRMAQGLKAIGNITTSNYVYYVSVGNKLSFLVRTHLEEEEALARSKYVWPMSQVDTNAAYRLACQFLAAASMDVNALNTNCDLHIDTCLLEGANGKYFVPLYWIYWSEKQKRTTWRSLC